MLAVILLIEGVQLCRCTACTGSQEGGGSGGLLVAGPSTAVVVGQVMCPRGGGGSGWPEIAGPSAAAMCRAGSWEGGGSDLHLLKDPQP